MLGIHTTNPGRDRRPRSVWMERRQKTAEQVTRSPSLVEHDAGAVARFGDSRTCWKDVFGSMSLNVDAAVFKTCQGQ